MTQTPLDHAHAAWMAAPEDPKKQLAFFARLAASELFLMLRDTPDGDRINPDVFELENARYILAFDTEDRLAQFAERIVPYVAVSGRSLAQMLAGQETGIALNPETAPSSMLLDPDSVDWLAHSTSEVPDETQGRPEEILPPQGLPEAFLERLDQALAGAAGLAHSAYLVAARYPGGAITHLLGIIDAQPGTEAALAQLTQESLTFSGLEAGTLDVAFFARNDTMAATLARHGLRFDIPQPERPAPHTAPGSNPDAPPKLR